MFLELKIMLKTCYLTEKVLSECKDVLNKNVNENILFCVLISWCLVKKESVAFVN